MIIIILIHIIPNISTFHFKHIGHLHIIIIFFHTIFVICVHKFGLEGETSDLPAVSKISKMMIVKTKRNKEKTNKQTKNTNSNKTATDEFDLKIILLFISIYLF